MVGCSFFAGDVYPVSIYVNNVSTLLIAVGAATFSDSASYNTKDYTIDLNNRVVWNDGKFLAYNDAIVLGSDDIVTARQYTTIEQSTSSGETWVLDESVSALRLYYVWDGSASAETVTNGSNSDWFTTNYTSPGPTTGASTGNYYFIGIDHGGLPQPGATSSATLVYESSSWADQSYRTITFSIAPTGDLLTWLQANGTKQ